MKTAPLPATEAKRLAALKTFNILDTLPEQAFDDITLLAAQITGTPIALVSLIDDERQWFKSHHGLDATETPRDFAFCAHAILEPDTLFEIPDSHKDERFQDNPLVTDDPNVRFYAGAPLVTSKGHALGTLCVIDHEPRRLSEGQAIALRALSRQVMAQLDLRAAIKELRDKAAQQKEYESRLESYQKRLEEQNNTLLLKSSTDALTGLANRHAFQERLDDEFHRWQRHNRPLSLIVLDVDNFKQYNDSQGHPEGDKVLIEVAHCLNECCRTSDIVARIGGEEFAVILPDTDSDSAFIVAERLRKMVESKPWPRRPVTISLGLGSAQAGMSEGLRLFSECDQALYRAKESGRNRVCPAGLAPVPVRSGRSVSPH